MIFHDCDGNVIPYDNSPLSFRVSVYALILDDKKIFVVKNKNEKLYDIPGGGIDIGESIEDALQRECTEEAGIQVAIGPIIHVKSDFFYHREQKKFYQTFQLFYSAKVTGEKTQPTEESTVFADFVSIDTLDIHPLPTNVIEALQRVL